jgi:outer membrane protein assembly factor BamD (BamD/ComL family)
MVSAARDALRAGDSASALSLLAKAQQRFGAGVLGQEREALTVEGLARSGQQAAAQSRGRAFLKNYANSPYAARIRALIGAN